jgi:predicted transcriptional regulator of viral defense system
MSDLSPISPSLERQKTTFQSELLRRVSTASEEFPTVRCWSSRKLRSLLGGLRSSLLDQRLVTSSFPRTDGLLAWLSDAGLVHPLPVEPGVTAKAEDTFYLVEVGSGPQSTVSPFELLQAFQPQGIVSFFSALSFHSLTTQTPPFHHSVALTPRPPSIPRERAAPEIVTSSVPAASAVRRDSLGSHAFTYAGTRYFSTKRFRDLVPGVQTQILDPRIHLRVTDIEQTLLDTLMHPDASGGQSVIFETWEQGLGRARPERMAGYLEAIALPVLTRRVGALLNLTGAAIPAPLRSVLEQVRRLLSVDSVPQVPLFRGQSGDRLDPEWNVLTPA